MRSQLIVIPTSPPTRLAARLRGLAQDEPPAPRLGVAMPVLLGIAAGLALAYARRRG